MARAGDTLSLAGDELEDDELGAEDSASSSSSSAPKRKKRRGGDEAPGARTRRRHEGELRNRLELTLERIAEWLEGRGDLELAGVIREDSKAMIGGLVSLTRPLGWLRPPLIAVLSVVEPVLAFGRVLRILGGRLADRRARAREAAVVDWTALTDGELESAASAGYAEADAELARRRDLAG